MQTANKKQTRHNALERIRLSRAQIVFLIAPAGYGKTTVANALRKDYPRSAVCDCTDALTPASLARAVLSALAMENPDNAEEYYELQVRVRPGDGEAECANVIASAWQSIPSTALFTFENAETVAGNGAVASLLTRLLFTVPAGRRIVVCSRLALPTRAGRYLPPHQLLTIGLDELALDDEEATRILRERGVSQADYPYIIEISQGWPILLLLLARISAEGRLHEMGDHENVVLEDLFSYLLHEVLEPLDDRSLHALALCAVVPNLTATELADALETTDLAVQRLLRDAPLLHREGDAWSAHAVMKPFLLERVTDWKRYVISIAQADERRGDQSRASALFRLIGDEESSARVLESLPVDQLMSPRLAAELANISPAVIRAHPRLALAIFNRAAFTPEFQALLSEIFENLRDDEDPALVANVARAIVSANWWFGNVEGNRRILSSVRLKQALSSNSALAREAFIGVAECFYASLGEIESNIGAMKSAYKQALHATLVHPCTLLARKIASSERWRGEKQSSIEWCDAALMHALASGSALLYSSLLIDALINAWFWGEDDLFAKYEAQLEAWSMQVGFDAQFATLHGALRGEVDVALVPLPRPNAVFVQLMAASHFSGGAGVLPLIAQAQALAESTEEVPLIALCRVAAASHHGSSADDIVADALTKIDTNELPVLRAAIESYRKGLPSFLDAFVARFRSDASHDEVQANIEIRILDESVRVGADQRKLSAREAALMAYLSRQRSGVSREEIQDALWPELDEKSARDSLYSLIYRIRHRSGNHEVIENFGNAYRIAQGVRVDLWSIQSLVRDIERGGNAPLPQVEHYHSAIRHRSYRHLVQFEWFETMDYQIRQSVRTLARRLIQDAFQKSEYERVLNYANALLLEDDLDDWAYEAIIRVNIESGNMSEALQVYQRYCSVVEKTTEAGFAPEIESLMQQHGLLLSQAS